MMRKYALLLIAGNVLTEIWGWFPESWQHQKFDMFLKPGFHMDVTFSWYVKMLMDDLNSVIIFFVLSMISARLSRTLFYVSSVFLTYHIIDSFLLIWDFKQTREIYLVLLLASIAAIVIMIRKRKMKKV